jgi:hypothetical protein
MHFKEPNAFKNKSHHSGYSEYTKIRHFKDPHAFKIKSHHPGYSEATKFKHFKEPHALQLNCITPHIAHTQKSCISNYRRHLK